MECCDDRLKPPWIARSSRAMTLNVWNGRTLNKNEQNTAVAAAPCAGIRGIVVEKQERADWHACKIM